MTPRVSTSGRLDVTEAGPRLQGTIKSAVAVKVGLSIVETLLDEAPKRDWAEGSTS
jgi:4-hydroxy-3-methylbut-2-en-1-yl diphosphate synthase IspG/GcpE